MDNPQPNIVLILADDLGFSDLGCYGSEIKTPNLDSLADTGVRLRDFHSTPRCSPSRASLMTGLHPHQAGIGILTGDDSDDGGYRGNLDADAATLAERLAAAGYQTGAVGKWHLAADAKQPNGSWPTQRGFESFYGTLTGCGSYYQPGTLTRGLENVEDDALAADFFYTDRIADEAISFVEGATTAQPFLLYLPFTAPHWPLHAREATIAPYRGIYEQGWDAIRAARYERQLKLGVVDHATRLSPRDPSVPSWEAEPNQAWQVERMSVYAAMVEEMDTAIGRILSAIDGSGRRENTIVVFLSDNGASADPVPLIELEYFRERSEIVRQATRAGADVEVGNDPRVMPGGEGSYQSYGRGWANVSNTPYRRYKLWTHEGGLASPFIFNWPNGGLKAGRVLPGGLQLTHVLPTLLEAAGVSVSAGTTTNSPPLASSSVLAGLRGDAIDEGPLWWEHCGNAAYQSGRWKIVREYGFDWELYDVETDRSEQVDLAGRHKDVVADLVSEWRDKADAVGVIDFRKTLEIYRTRGLGWTSAIG